MANFTPTIHPWNQQIWQNLTNEPERANHALLFTGDKGLGKKELAFALSHFVLTDTHSQSETLFNAGSHPDLHIIMPEIEIAQAEEGGLVDLYARRYIESHSGKPKRTITIEQIRKLGLTLNTHPHISKYRVIIIYHAETMNRNASNALLKNLEEPPANTLFLVVSDEISELAKTVRSRCSLINFRAPEFSIAKAWLELQTDLPSHELDSHLAMANNQPMLALELYKDGYIGSLKSVFTDVNGLWNQAREPIQVAKNWQTIGAIRCVEILQKLTTDLLRCCLSESPKFVFFPVQETWVKSSSSKISRDKLLETIDALADAKRLLSTTVDELLVLETVSNKFRQLPT